MSHCALSEVYMPLELKSPTTVPFNLLNLILYFIDSYL